MNTRYALYDDDKHTVLFYFECVQYHNSIWYVQFVQSDGTQIDIPPGVTMRDSSNGLTQAVSRVLCYATIDTYELCYNDQCIATFEPRWVSRVRGGKRVTRVDERNVPVMHQ